MDRGIFGRQKTTHYPVVSEPTTSKTSHIHTHSSIICAIVRSQRYHCLYSRGSGEKITSALPRSANHPKLITRQYPPFIRSLSNYKSVGRAIFVQTVICFLVVLRFWERCIGTGTVVLRTVTASPLSMGIPGTSILTWCMT